MAFLESRKPINTNSHLHNRCLLLHFLRALDEQHLTVIEGLSTWLLPLLERYVKVVVGLEVGLLECKVELDVES